VEGEVCGLVGEGLQGVDAGGDGGVAVAGCFGKEEGFEGWGCGGHGGLGVVVMLGYYNLSRLV